MKLKYIEFTFENCDSLTIDGKYIGEFLVNNLHKVIRRTASNSIDELNVAKTVVMEISKDANVERYQFGQTDYEDFKQTVFDRLKEYDITQISFVLEATEDEDSKTPIISYHYSYFVDWVGGDQCINRAQSSYISKCGNLYLVIEENAGVEDYFNIDEIDDQEIMDINFSMCGVGDNDDE